MEKRVEKGEKYWCVGGDMNPIEAIAGFDWAMDTLRFEAGNCFKDYHECFVMCNKLRHVLAGADVIEMPSEEEAVSTRETKRGRAAALDIAEDERSYNDGFADCYQWLKSKTIK